MKLGLSSHNGWTGRFPSLVICARSSEKAFSKTLKRSKNNKNDRQTFNNVIPECFNRKSKLWIPAFAGMTDFCFFRLF